MAGPYTLSGSGQQLIAKPRGLKVEVLQRGPGATVGFAQPANLYHVGLVRWGNADGFFPPVPIDADLQQLVLPPEMDTLGFRLAPSAQIRVTETLGSLTTPFQRRTSDVAFGSGTTVNGGTATTTAVDYSVPSGFTLLLERAGLLLSRSVVASSQGSVFLYVQIDGVSLLFCHMFGGQVGAFMRDDLGASELYVTAGQRLTVQYGNSDTGGQVYAYWLMRGFLFR